MLSIVTPSVKIRKRSHYHFALKWSRMFVPYVFAEYGFLGKLFQAKSCLSMSALLWVTMLLFTEDKRLWFLCPLVQETELGSINKFLDLEQMYSLAL